MHPEVQFDRTSMPIHRVAEFLKYETEVKIMHTDDPAEAKKLGFED